MNLGAKEHIRDGEVVVVGFVNRLLWWLQCGRLLLSRLLIEYAGDNPYLALIFRGNFNPFSWCSWAFSNLEWRPSNEKILKSYPNSFVQVVKCFSKLKNGDKSFGKEKKHWFGWHLTSVNFPPRKGILCLLLKSGSELMPVSRCRILPKFSGA